MSTKFETNQKQTHYTAVWDNPGGRAYSLLLLPRVNNASPTNICSVKMFFLGYPIMYDVNSYGREDTHTHARVRTHTHTHSHTHSHTHNDTLYELHKLTCTDLIALTSFLLSSVFNILLTCVCTKFDLKRISLTHIPRVHTSIQKSNRTIYPCMHNTHEHTHMASWCKNYSRENIGEFQK